MTKAQRIVRAVQKHWDLHKVPPSIRWITDEAKISTTSLTVYHIEKLVKIGILQYSNPDGNRKLLRPTLAAIERILHEDVQMGEPV